MPIELTSRSEGGALPSRIIAPTPPTNATIAMATMGTVRRRTRDCNLGFNRAHQIPPRRPRRRQSLEKRCQNQSDSPTLAGTPQT